MDQYRGEAFPDEDFIHPLSIRGIELQESVIASELPGDTVPVVLRVYRLALVWGSGEGALDHVSNPPDLVAWEEEILLRTGQDERFWAPVAVIVGELQDPAADPEQMARAWMVLSEWAFSSGWTASGLLFAEAAALVSKNNPRRAYLAGRMLLNRHRVREASAWLQRAVRIAVENGDEEAYGLASDAVRQITQSEVG